MWDLYIACWSAHAGLDIVCGRSSTLELEDKKRQFSTVSIEAPKPWLGRQRGV